MKTKITKTAVDAHKPKVRADGKLVPDHLWDTELIGFGCKATPGGKKVYIFQYQLNGRSGKTETVTLGDHGAITCEQARKLARIDAGRVARGENPAEEKREAKRKAATTPTFGKAMQLYLDINEEGHASWFEVRRVLNYDALPAWENRPIDSITKQDVAALLDRVQARSPAAVRSLYAQLRPLFKWAARSYIEKSPMAELTPPAPLKARRRFLSLDEIPVFWRAVLTVDWPFSELYRVLLLTGQRRSEVAGMRRQELDFANATWRMPSAEEYQPQRTKNGEEHIVDLSPQVLAILKSLPRVHGCDLMFSTTGTTPPSGFSKAKNRIDAAMCAELNPDRWEKFYELGGESEDADVADAAAKKLGFSDAKKLKASILRPWRTHDLRRTWATHVGEQLNFREAVVERALNHLTGTQSGLTGVYQCGEFLPERLEAMRKWGRFIEKIINE